MLFLQHMKTFLFTSVYAALVLSSCSSPLAYGPAAASSVEAGEGGEGKIRKKGTLTMKSRSLKESSDRAVAMVRTHRGVLSDSSLTEDDYESTIRVPSMQLEPLMDELGELGKVTYRRVSQDDVTKRHYDLQAEIKNKTELRNRLRTLLSKSDKVEDTLEVEKELARVQTELDQLTGAFSKLKSQVTLSTLNFSIERSRNPGPLGLVGKGISKVWDGLWHLN